ncbi:MAG: hypothetical protein QNJ85_09835 [Gammaproteobacteria bacterium]|nr:hypothetical protein [Gammaproteobacteria bacterium]
MNTSDMYDKTAKGKTEIADNAAGLSMMERRVLILVNGENDVDTLKKLSLCDDIGTTLDRLLELDLIESGETTIVDITTPTGAADADSAGGASSEGGGGDGDELVVEAREFMCNTLQTFGNRVRIVDLNNAIADTSNIGELEGLVKPWYHAISETPGGMYQADDLRKDLLALLDRGKQAA